MKKSKVKMAKYAIFGQFPQLVPVPNRGGTGTAYAKPKWYRYQDKVVPVALSRTGLVPVPIQVVLVPLLPVAMIFGILTLLSSNSHTKGIGTLINDYQGFK